MSRHLRTWLAILALLVAASFLPLPAYADEGSLAALTGCQPSPTSESLPAAVSPQAAGSLPERVDLRAGLPPVGDQGMQNSCVAWAVGYYYKSFQEAREQQWSLDVPEHQFSPAYIYSQRPNASCSQDRGMTIAAAMSIVQRGAAPLSAMPYDRYNTCAKPDAATLSAAAEYRAASYAMLFQGIGQANLNQIKAHLAGGDPVVLAIPVYSNFKAAAPGRSIIGVPPAGSSMLGGHAVLIVGYDSDGFLIVNSQGTRWGEGGFAHLTYDFVQQYAWEAWIMQDLDATPPTLPASCALLSPAGASLGKSAGGKLVFTWSGATDHGGSGIQVYRLYWGPNPAGQSPFVKTTATAITLPAPRAGQTYYLRMQVVDRARNASAWQTLYTLKGQ